MMKSLSQELRLLISIFGIPAVIVLRPWREDIQYAMGLASLILSNTMLPVVNSCTNYNVTTHRALLSISQILPQKGIVKFN